MGNFSIDNQTFKDLQVFGDQSNSASVFDLFKGTRTQGARDQLREMMRNPSSDIELLKLRSGAIAYFHKHQLNLDFRNEELDLITFYLSSDKRKSKSNLIDSLSDYFTKNSSNDYYIIKTGIKYLLKLSRYIFDFVKDNSSEETPSYLIKLFEEITTIIEEGILNRAILLDENKLKFFQINQLDSAIRGKEIGKINELLQLIYELDVFENVALVARKYDLTFPVYNADEKIQVKLQGLFHFGLQNPVKNDVIIDHNKNIVFLTGSNMAGKSSLLKSLGLAIYLSHLGFPVAAEAMNTTVFNGLITTINLNDNIDQGLSHYYSEVKRVKDVALQLSENNRIVVIFDELFRGTNVKDASEASLLIISELASVKNSIFIISTHIVEIAAELKKFENISFNYLETFFKDKKPVFTYKLKNGVSEERLGMYIVLNEGIVETIRKAK